MQIVSPHAELLTIIDKNDFLQVIERAGRTCYKSEEKITIDSAESFVKKLIEREHEAMLEHAPSISMKFVCDRGVSHEIVRHRLFSFAQESTRYCNYSGDKFGSEITVIKPLFLTEGAMDYRYWKDACETAEINYLKMLNYGRSAQEARSVLPNSLKTEIIVTGNIREWRHFFKLRTAPAAHPQMQEVAKMALRILKDKVSIVFDDIEKTAN